MNQSQISRLERLRAALADHQRGDLAAAEAGYQRVIDEAPDDASARYLLGSLALHLGQRRRAAANLRLAVTLEPGAAEGWLLLASPELAFGGIPFGRRASSRALALAPLASECITMRARVEEAAEAYGNAAVILGEGLRSFPADVEMRIQRARMVLRSGAPTEARRELLAAVTFAPSNHHALFLLGETARLRDCAAEALRSYERALAAEAVFAKALCCAAVLGWQIGRRRSTRQVRSALALEPQLPDAWFCVGEMLRKQESWRAAAVAYRRANALDTSELRTLNHLGNVLDEADAHEEAVVVLERARSIDPLSHEVRGNLGTALLHCNRFHEAATCYRIAVVLRPDDAVAHYNLGNSHRQSLDLPSALGAFGRANAIDPFYARAQWNDGVTRLMAGDFAAGWRKYDWRWQDRSVQLPEYAPWWRGEPLEGRRIILFGEQGFGDMVHFARYAPIVAGMGGSVVLECYPELKRLFSTLGSGIELVDIGTRPTGVDCQAALMQLPMLLGTSLATIPARIPYLSPPDEGPRLPGGEGAYKVGLVWSGNPRIERFHKRSARLADFEPLLKIPDIALFSLQVGSARAEIGALGAGDRLIDLAPLIGDFADTAKLIDQLDLVISVDTAAGHVAGAIGRNVWLMINHVPDWRWLLGRDDTPWYPTMRLYRQGPERKWSVVVDRIARDLTRVAQRRR